MLVLPIKIIMMLLPMPRRRKYGSIASIVEKPIMLRRISLRGIIK
jgi:hypothetical protein